MIFNINNENAMRQAPMTALTYLDEITASLDQKFGPNYAERNPQLVAALVNAAAQDYHSTVMGSMLQSIETVIDHRLLELGSATYSK